MKTRDWSKSDYHFFPYTLKCRLYNQIYKDGIKQTALEYRTLVRQRYKEVNWRAELSTIQSLI